MDAAGVAAVFQQIKKAVIERALGAELGLHLAGPDGGLGTHRNGRSGKTAPQKMRSAASDIRSPFKEKALWQDGRRHVFNILCGHSTGKETVSPLPNNHNDSINLLVHRVQRKVSALGFGEDAGGGGCPAIGFGMPVAMIEAGRDGTFQIGNAAEHAAPDLIFGEVAEESLDQIEPGCTGRREVQMEARMLGQLGVDLGVLVGGVVVDDQMQIKRPRGAPIQMSEEGKELVVSVLGQALANHLAADDVERGKQRRRPMPLVVMAQRLRLATFERQPGLGPELKKA